jgi:hypothetical protein
MVDNRKVAERIQSRLVALRATGRERWYSHTLVRQVDEPRLSNLGSCSCVEDIHCTAAEHCSGVGAGPLIACSKPIKYALTVEGMGSNAVLQFVHCHVPVCVDVELRPSSSTKSNTGGYAHTPLCELRHTTVYLTGRGVYRDVLMSSIQHRCFDTDGMVRIRLGTVGDVHCRVSAAAETGSTSTAFNFIDTPFLTEVTVRNTLYTCGTFSMGCVPVPVA